MSYKVKIDQQAVNALLSAVQPALEQTAEALYEEVLDAGVIPDDTGELRDSGHIEVFGGTDNAVAIVSDAPYAGRLYFHPELDFHAPGAKAFWYEDWLPGGSREGRAAELFAEHYKAEAGV